MRLEDIYPIDQATADRRARALERKTAWEVRWVVPSKVIAAGLAECRWQGDSTDVERVALALHKAGYKPKIYGDIHAGNFGV